MSLKHRLKRWGHTFFQYTSGPTRSLPESLWKLSYQKDSLHLHGHSLEALLSSWGSPLHVVDMQRLEENYKAFCSGPQAFPTRCEVFASYKTNPVPGVLERLHQLGAGAEVISEYELWLALHLGVPAEKIIYNGPAKSLGSLEIAVDRGILSLNINHREEIEILRTVAQKLKKSVRVSVRIVLDKGWSGQLGMEASQALETYRQLLSIPEFEVVGVHCHRGLAIRKEEELQSYLSNLLSFVAVLQQQTGFVPQLLNIGGSLAIPTVDVMDGKALQRAIRYGIAPSAPDPLNTLTPASYSQLALDTIQRYFQDKRWSIPRIMLEPGRALTGNSQMLLCRVMSLRAEPLFTYAICDAGISIADSMQSDYHQIFPLKTHNQGQALYRLVGPICHMGDTLRYALRLPQLRPGDGLAIMDAGAYFIPESRSFSFPQPGIIALESSGELSLLRRAESFADIIHRDQQR